MTVTAEESHPKFKIAVVGGGLVGAFAAAVFSKLTDAEISVYEKSEGPQEVGAAITLTEGSIVTLGRVLGHDELQPLLYRSPKHSHTVSRHWKTGEYLKATEPTYPRPSSYLHAKAHRVDLLNFILKGVPEGTVNYGYEVAGVELEPDGVTINFAGKDSVKVDLLVSADGIYSKIRRQFTNDRAVYKGAVAYRNVFDESILDGIEGVPDEITVWVGRDSLMFMTKLPPNQFNVAAHLHDPPEIAEKLRWNHTTGEWGRKRLIEHFKDWDPIIGKILKVMPESIAFPLERTPWLNDLVVGNRIAFVGDSAHPTSGVYGAGAALGFDDVWALYRGLSETKLDKTYRLEKALFLFNETRRHFLLRVEVQTKIDAQIQKRYVDASKDDDEWKKRVAERGLVSNWISEHSSEAEYQKVRDKYFVPVFIDDVPDLEKLVIS